MNYKTGKYLYEGFNKEKSNFKKIMAVALIASLPVGYGLKAGFDALNKTRNAQSINQLEKAIDKWDQGECKTLQDCYKLVK